MTTYKSSEREAFVYWWRHKYSAADLEGIPEHVALNAAWAAWQARAALPQQAQQALDALNALCRENEIPMSDRNGELYDTIAAIAKGEQP